MAQLRNKPYFWVTWLTPLLSGEDNCEWKVWMKAHYQGLAKLDLGFDSSQWNENHTALLNELKREYQRGCERLLMEGQTSWRIDGKTATVAGKMDLLTQHPNLVIDAKTGKAKDSHVLQMKIYLLALELGAVPGVSGKFKGVLRYADGHSTEVLSCDALFKQRLFSLVKRLAGVESEPVPSLYECRFCDLADCEARFVEQKALYETTEF